jgi:hypothetical protein
MSAASPPLPRNWTIIALAAIAAAAIAISVYAAIAEKSDSSSFASTYSRSAIGHAGLLALLKTQGIDATATTSAPPEKLRQGGLLVLAEPDFDPSSGAALKTLLRGRSVLLVLPKWTGTPESSDRGWLANVYLKPLPLVQAALDDAAGNGRTTRGVEKFVPARNLLGAAPRIEAPVQLLAPGPKFRQLIADADGNMLAAFMPTRYGQVWILSDPGVINNFGLAHGNANLAVALINRARHGGPVVFDETIHGFSSVPNGRFRLLIARPFRAATVEALLAIALLLWATSAAFGARLARPAPLAAGKQALIANIADLLIYAGHQGELVRRYMQVTLEDVAARLHAPAADGAARAAWMDQVQAQRGSVYDAATLQTEALALTAARRTAPGAVFALAQKIHRWKQDMLHGA